MLSSGLAQALQNRSRNLEPHYFSRQSLDALLDGVKAAAARQ
jgi:hypothetical protein